MSQPSLSNNSPRSNLGLLSLAGRIVILLMLASGSSGCSDLFQQAAPAKSLFAIDPGVPAFSSDRPTTSPSPSQWTLPVLQVRLLQMSPPYDGTAFVYKTGPCAFELDYYNNFVAAPADLLTADLIQWLTRERTFSIVELNPTIPADLVLDCGITKLLIDFSDPHKPLATITAHFLLYKREEMQLKVLSESDCRADVPVASNTPAGYVAAWGQAYRELLQQEQVSIHQSIERLIAEGHQNSQ